MKILIPMAGMSKRFMKAGVTVPKPLIEVEGLPMIKHIVRNFSDEDEFVFGINERDDAKTSMASLLKAMVPRNQIIRMPYQEEGPVASTMQMSHCVRDDEPVIVNHCDFSWRWDYDNFKRQIRENRCDGAVICYRDFHPHLLGPNLYATLDAEGFWMKEIREKFSWHGDKKRIGPVPGLIIFEKEYMSKNTFKKSWRDRS